MALWPYNSMTLWPYYNHTTLWPYDPMNLWTYDPMSLWPSALIPTFTKPITHLLLEDSDTKDQKFLYQAMSAPPRGGFYILVTLIITIITIITIIITITITIVTIPSSPSPPLKVGGPKGWWANCALACPDAGLPASYFCVSEFRGKEGGQRTTTDDDDDDDRRAGERRRRATTYNNRRNVRIPVNGIKYLW